MRSVAVVVTTISAIGVAALISVGVEVAAEVVAALRGPRAGSRLLVGLSASETRVTTWGLLVNLLLGTVVVRDTTVGSDTLGLCYCFGNAHGASVNGTDGAEVDAARAGWLR